MHCAKQSSPRYDLNNFDIRVIVAGSRDYENYREFCMVIRDWLNKIRRTSPDAKIIFISGCARTGADAMIIEWARDWDDLEAPGAVIKTRRDGKRYNVRAGFARNTAMAQVATHLLTFWDGFSTGTDHMRQAAKARDLDVETFLVHCGPEED
jgi:hypothetical protein